MRPPVPPHGDVRRSAVACAQQKFWDRHWFKAPPNQHHIHEETGRPTVSVEERVDVHLKELVPCLAPDHICATDTKQVSHSVFEEA
uniref:Uncharacterized protein n=1 Tax=Globodera pallida TaxID=36090 RepID=A0A183BYS7_GLOPA